MHLALKTGSPGDRKRAEWANGFAPFGTPAHGCGGIGVSNVKSRPRQALEIRPARYSSRNHSIAELDLDQPNPPPPFPRPGDRARWEPDVLHCAGSLTML